MVGSGAKVLVFDPHGRKKGQALLPKIEKRDDAYAACDGADLVAILTEWNKFQALDLGRRANVVRRPVMGDLQNIYGPDQAVAVGLVRYEGAGR